MAIIFSYSPIQSTDVTASDRLILSQMNSDGNPTRSITVGELSKFISNTPAGGPFLPLTAGSTVPLTGDLYMAATGTGPSVGSNAIVFKGVDDTGTELTSAEIFTLDSSINPSGQDLYFNNADDAGVLQTGLFIDAFQQVAIAKGSASAQLDVGGSFNADGNVTFSGYGSGTKTGTAVYSLAVDASGNVIESFFSLAPTFDATNSSASGRIRIGATASATSSSTDAVFIGSALTNSNNDEQINIGHNNDGTGTQNMIYGSNNTQTGNGAYSVLIGTLNQVGGNTSVAIGRNHNLGTSDTYTIGEANQSSFTGGVSSGGLMNVSIGYGNQLDVDKGAVFGFGNDVTGSFGWTIGSGNETVVIGNRLTMSLLGPNRSGTTGPRVIIATGEFIGAGPENKKNSVEYYTPEASRSGVFHPALYNSASYADDTAAAAGGVRLGELYRNGSVIQIRMT